MNKVIAIIGPTASGKSAIGVDLARKFNGEIISADSRQIYKGLDIGSGKITAEETRGIPHYLLDIADPMENFSLADYLKLARPILADIMVRHKTPFIVGGTGLYITALLEGYKIPEVGPDKSLRQKLENKTLTDLQAIYQKLDPSGFNKIAKQNPRRLIRAIEVVKLTGRPFFEQQIKTKHGYDSLVLGIEVPFDELKQKIKQRIDARFPAMLDETVELNKKGVPWSRLENFGLEYKWMAKLAKNEISQQQALEKLEKEIIAYAKRQLTWWKKRKVLWVKNLSDAVKNIMEFLS